jgi:DNA-directed DNA polymerase III PolC
MYIHLTTHSAYSLQESLALPIDLVQAARASGMTALGLTDHWTLTGSIEFVYACREAGIQPVLGLEIDLPEGKLALFATSLVGWGSLCKLSSALALRDDPQAVCPWELLAANTTDLLALGDGEAPEATLGRLKELFPAQMALGLSDPARGLPTSNRARNLGVPLVITHPVYYLTPEQASLQRTLAAIRLIQPLSSLPEEAAAPPGAYFTSAKEMEARFRHFPAALNATREIAERCKFELPLGQPHMPVLPLPAGKSAAQVLREKAEAGALRLYGSMTPQIQTRLDHEIEVIARMGFEPIFLIVEDLLNFARDTGVPYSSRGSAASSLVAHCLGITSPDPLRLNLYFERFLNPARSTPPDIDTDLCSNRREAVIQHVFDTYGSERVAMVATINHFRPRSALGDVAKAHGIEPAKVREMVKKLPYSFWARFEEAEGEEGALPPSPFAELRAGGTWAQYERVFDEAQAILKLPRHLSVHPGGVIVAPGLLTDLVPVTRSGSKGLVITQFDLGSVEALGLVKIDLLGIRGLTVLGDVGEFIQASQPQRYASRLSVLDSIPHEDTPTADRVENGQTIGCFQIESPGMRTTLREIHARSEDDIMAALALYRPGPLSGGLKDAFVRRFKGQEKVAHLHPALAPLLDETFGVILYQEQVLKIANELAGFNLAEADLLRRAMSHFDPGKRMQELEHKFVSEAYAQSNVPLETGERIWEMMAAFAGYGFPKAHAASYASVAWRSAWCKNYFPAEFMAAVLANWGGYYSQRVYLSEARRMGLTVRPPHINYSGRNFVVSREMQALYMGLDQVKDLTRGTIERIMRGRPFQTLDDFLLRADPRQQEAEKLARVGALEGLGSIPSLLRRVQKTGTKWQAGQMNLFGWNEPDEEAWSTAQKMEAQQEFLGVSLEAHPLEMVIDLITAARAISTLDAAGRVGQRVTVAGIRQTAHRSRTASGDSMLFLTIEDLSGTLDVILFPNIYHQAKNTASSNQPLLITGLMEMDVNRGEPTLRAEKVVALE